MKVIPIRRRLSCSTVLKDNPRRTVKQQNVNIVWKSVLFTIQIVTTTKVYMDKKPSLL